MDPGVEGGPSAIALSGPAARHDLVFIRTTCARPAKRKLVQLPPALTRRLSQHDLCVTVHRAAWSEPGGEWIVDVEPAQAQGIDSPIAVLSVARAQTDVGALRESMQSWSCRREVLFTIAGCEAMITTSARKALQSLLQAGSFHGCDPHRRLLVSASDDTMLRALQELQGLGVVERIPPLASWALTRDGMERVRTAHALSSPKRVFAPHAALEMIADFTSATNWELMALMRCRGWSLARRPSASKLRRSPLPPLEKDNRPKKWYLSSTSLDHSRMYMIALLRSDDLLNGTVVVQIHHCQRAKYYSALLSESSDGTIAPDLAAVAEPPPMALKCDIAPQLALVSAAEVDIHGAVQEDAARPISSRRPANDLVVNSFAQALPWQPPI